MHRRLSVFLCALLLVVLAAAVPAAAAAPERGPRDLSRVFSFFSWDQVIPDLAAVFHPRMQNVTANAVQPYCYSTEGKCQNAQRAASGTKSACYKSGTQWCYDLFLPGEPGGRLPPIQGD